MQQRNNKNDEDPWMQEEETISRYPSNGVYHTICYVLECEFKVQDLQLQLAQFTFESWCTIALSTCSIQCTVLAQSLVLPCHPSLGH